MMTSSNGNIFRVTGPLCEKFIGPGEFPTQKPVTRSFDVFFDLRLNKRLSKQLWGWWFETPLCSLWRHCDAQDHCCYQSGLSSLWLRNMHSESAPPVCVAVGTSALIGHSDDDRRYRLVYSRKRGAFTDVYMCDNMEVLSGLDKIM